MALLRRVKKSRDKSRQSRISIFLFRYVLLTFDEWRDLGPSAFWTIISAILARMAFPEMEWGWAAWVCLIPFLRQLHYCSPKEGGWLGFIFGFVFFYLNLIWLNELKHFTEPNFLAFLAPVGLALFCSLSTVLFGALTAVVMPRRGWFRFFFVPALWTSIEFIRSLSELAFPWMYLAHTQVQHTTLLQICDITGVFGLTFVIVLVNLAVSDSYRLVFRQCSPDAIKRLIPRWSIALGAIALILIYGFLRTQNLPLIPSRWDKNPDSFRVALIQPGVRQTLKQESTQRVTTETLEFYVQRRITQMKEEGLREKEDEKLLQLVAEANVKQKVLEQNNSNQITSQKFESLVQDESKRINEKGLTGEGLIIAEAMVRQNALNWGAYVEDIRLRLYEGIGNQIAKVVEACADNLSKPDLYVLPETAFTNPDFNSSPSSLKFVHALSKNIAGAPILFGADRSEKIKGEPGEYRMYNSVYIARPETGVDLENVYDKMHLVPFGEYSSYFRIIPNFTEKFLGMLDFSWGTSPTLFQVQGRTFAPLICFESCFPSLFRKYDKLNPDCMVVQTNDAWYGISSGAYRHMTQSIFRAIETRRPLIRVANTGISCIIDPWGRTYAHLELVATGPMQTSWPLLFRPEGMKDYHTIYMRFGEWFPLLCVFFSGYVFYRMRPRRARRKQKKRSRK